MEVYKSKPSNFPLLLTVHLSYALTVHVHIAVGPSKLVCCASCEVKTCHKIHMPVSALYWKYKSSFVSALSMVSFHLWHWVTDHCESSRSSGQWVGFPVTTSVPNGLCHVHLTMFFSYAESSIIMRKHSLNIFICEVGMVSL